MTKHRIYRYLNQDQVSEIFGFKSLDSFRRSSRKKRLLIALDAVSVLIEAKIGEIIKK